MLSKEAGAPLVDSPPHAERSDDDLIREIQKGNAELFKVLAERHQEMVFSLVFRQTGDRGTASELSQEILVKAYFGLKRFRFEAKFSTWLTRIALNETNGYFSSKAYRRQRMQESFEVERHDMVQPEADGALETERKLLRFQRALPQLKSKFRDVMILCSVEGKSYEEAAAILRIPVGTVRSRLNTARLTMKNIIAREIEQDGGDES